MRRAVTFFVATVVALLGALGPASAAVRQGSAGAPLTISLKDPNGTTSMTITIAADGTYKSDFGISSFDDYTATVKKSDGTTLATIPFTVTRAAEPCIAPTAGTGTDWGVTHSPFPVDPRFPSFVTICGRVALATTGNPSTPAGSPPSLGTPNSVTRDDAVSGDLGRSDSDDDGSDFPWLWIVVVIVIVGVGVIVIALWRRARTDAVGSMYPDYADDAGSTHPDSSDGAGSMYPDWYEPAPPEDPPSPEAPPSDDPPSSTPDVM